MWINLTGTVSVRLQPTAQVPAVLHNNLVLEPVFSH